MALARKSEFTFPAVSCVSFCLSDLDWFLPMLQGHVESGIT